METALNLVPKMPDKMAIVSPMLARAESLVVKTKEDVAAARIFGKDINAMISTIEADFKPTKQAIDASKAVVLQQEKNHLTPLRLAKDITAQKITAWDEAERRRIEEEQRAIAREQERVRQLALENARKKLDKLMAGMTDDTDKLTTLNAQLESPETTDEEAEVIRSQIRTIEARITTTVERAAEVEAKVEEVSQPVAPAMSAREVKTATGVNQVKEVTAVNMRVLVRWLAKEDCPVDPAMVLKIQDGAIKQLVQRLDIPGVSWRWASKTRF